MANNDVNNQKKWNNAFNGCRYITVVLGVVLLSAWTLKSASAINSPEFDLTQATFKEITGIVKNQVGGPIPGVVVKLAGTNVETVTDVEGKYKFNVKKGDKIQFICRGYKTSMATVRKSNVLNVKMEQDDAYLHDITISSICRSATGCAGVSAFSVKKNELNKNHIVDIAFPLIFNIDVTYRNPQTILKEVEDLTRNGKYIYIYLYIYILWTVYVLVKKHFVR